MQSSSLLLLGRGQEATCARVAASGGGKAPDLSTARAASCSVSQTDVECLRGPAGCAPGSRTLRRLPRWTFLSYWEARRALWCLQAA